MERAVSTLTASSCFPGNKYVCCLRKVSKQSTLSLAQALLSLSLCTLLPSPPRPSCVVSVQLLILIGTYTRCRCDRWLRL